MAILSKVVLATAVGTGVAETLLRTKSSMCSDAADTKVKCGTAHSSTQFDGKLVTCGSTKGSDNTDCNDACCVDITAVVDDALCKKYSTKKTKFDSKQKVAVGSASSFLQSSLPCSSKINSLAGKADNNAGSSVSETQIQDILSKCCVEDDKDNKSYYGLSPAYR